MGERRENSGSLPKEENLSLANEGEMSAAVPATSLP